MEWGERLAVVLDPDRNEICLGQKLRGAQRLRSVDRHG